MASLSRGRGRRDLTANIWPGFVDAMTTLLMVLIFVVTIFIVVQSALRDTIFTQNTELDQLSAQLADLGTALGLEKQRAAALEADLAASTEKVSVQGALIASLTGQLESATGQLAAANDKITAFEGQVAALLAGKAEAEGKIATLEGDLVKAQDERAQVAATAEELRARLKTSQDELTAMTLTLEQKRKEAEETLTLLAAAEAAKKGLDLKLQEALLAQVASEQGLTAKAGETETLRADLAAALAAKLAAEQAAQGAMAGLTEAEQKAALLAAAERALAEEKQITAEGARKLALLNEQVAALRTQLGELQAVLDASAAKDAEAQVQIDTLGGQLNAALARVAQEEKRRAELEAAERARLAAENQDLAKYRSEFFGKLSEVLAGREGVRVVGDRFVFSSEVLFAPGGADLQPEGAAQIARVAQTLQEVSAVIPPEIDWIIRVDGHTDNVPLSGQGAFKDNWALSQARALAVVRYMTEELGFPPRRLAAAGFGENWPVAEGDSEAARAANRRIELKLTER